MSETTILDKRPNTNGQPEKKNEGVAWKHVTLGGVSGILMGAGLLYAGQATAKELESTEQPKEEAPEADPQKSILFLRGPCRDCAVFDIWPVPEAYGCKNLF